MIMRDILQYLIIASWLAALSVAYTAAEGVAAVLERA
jgi:hypothetical protein